MIGDFGFLWHDVSGGRHETTKFAFKVVKL